LSSTGATPNAKPGKAAVRAGMRSAVGRRRIEPGQDGIERDGIGQAGRGRHSRRLSRMIGAFIGC
jgi:hypothetical protein